jgi:hypothetical protein
MVSEALGIVELALHISEARKIVGSIGCKSIKLERIFKVLFRHVEATELAIGNSESIQIGNARAPLYEVPPKSLNGESRITIGESRLALIIIGYRRASDLHLRECADRLDLRQMTANASAEQKCCGQDRSREIVSSHSCIP